MNHVSSMLADDAEDMEAAPLTMQQVAELDIPGIDRRIRDESPISALELKEAREKLSFLISQARRIGHPICELMMITPAIAVAILERNLGNRKISRSQIGRYAKDMIAGQWPINGETVIIAKTGETNDGQHRVYASYFSRTPFETFVVFGVERETRNTVDTNKVRTTGDILAMIGIENPKMVAAVHRTLSALKRSNYETLNQKVSPSSSDTCKAALSDNRLITSSAWAQSARGKIKNIAQASLAGAFHYIISGIDAAKAESFMNAIRDGEHLAADDPRLKARESLRKMAPRSRAEHRLEILIRGWNHYFNGTSIQGDKFKRQGGFPKIAGLP